MRDGSANDLVRSAKTSHVPLVSPIGARPARRSSCWGTTSVNRSGARPRLRRRQTPSEWLIDSFNAPTRQRPVRLTTASPGGASPDRTSGWMSYAADTIRS